ncbi:hypothetical protein LTR93_011782 [Exophiala xenobiotica]|nr:hypothetical protein LTR93_011782 [Exophiala xenobiotica]
MYGRDPYVFLNNNDAPLEIQEIIIGVLRSWDMVHTDYEYVDLFHTDGVLHVLDRPTKGHAAIRDLHDVMINPKAGPVVDIQHYVDRIFLMPYGVSGKMEAIFTGALTNILSSGESITHEYADLVIMSPNDRGALKAEHWRVYTNTVELMAAIGKLTPPGN